MNGKRMATFVFFTACASAYACHDDDHSHEAATGLPAGVIYEGDATDEGLAQIIGAQVKTGRSYSFTSPGAQAVLSAPTTFTWGEGQAPLDAGTGSLLPLRKPYVPSLGDLFRGERVAWAHGDPMNGMGYYLQFAPEGEATKTHVFTTASQYTPSADVWNAWKSTGKAISVRWKIATFESNNVASGGGPFEGVPLTFTIAK